MGAEIYDHTGVSKGTLYHHFSSEQALFPDWRARFRLALRRKAAGQTG